MQERKQEITKSVSLVNMAEALPDVFSWIVLAGWLLGVISTYVILKLFLFISFFHLFALNISLIQNALIGPDLGPDCLQRLSADNKSRH